VRFGKEQVGAKIIFDPFCGVGTVLAVANALGLDALGVEKARKRCEQARALRVTAAEL
jgi:tRNA G10  N-methylase Trm11